jgi:hypothetical protein
MKEIYWAPIVPTGSGTEYSLGQRELCENGSYWNGNVFQYVFDKMDYNQACSSVNAEYEGIICDLPNGAVVLSICGKPLVAYWAEEE